MKQDKQGLGAALSLALGLLLGAGAAAWLSRSNGDLARQALPTTLRKPKATDDDAPLFI